MYTGNLEPLQCGIPWADMDCIGITFYPKLADDCDATTEAMYEEALRQVREYLEPLSEAYAKPLFIIETFGSAVDCCAVNPSQAPETANYDFEEQRRWFVALFRAFSSTNQTRSTPLIKAWFPAIYRMAPDPWITSLPSSERLAPSQLNNVAGRTDLQHLVKVFFRDVPLERVQEEET